MLLCFEWGFEDFRRERRVRMAFLPKYLTRGRKFGPQGVDVHSQMKSRAVQQGPAISAASQNKRPKNRGRVYLASWSTPHHRLNPSRGRIFRYITATWVSSCRSDLL